MPQFSAPRQTLGDLDADVAARVLAIAGDVALVLDQQGKVLDVAYGGGELSRDDFQGWRDRAWADTVTPESRPKVEEMLRAAKQEAGPRWREINHTNQHGEVVPIRYVAVPSGKDGRVIAIGRDLRAVAALQQRLIQAQQAMERDYARLRQAESRYRTVFQIVSEPVIILDGARKVVEINPAAAQLVGTTNGAAIGTPFSRLLDRESIDGAATHLAQAEAAGQAGAILVRLKHEFREVMLSASPFRQEWGVHLLVRLSPTRAEPEAQSDAQRALLEVLERLPDAFVAADEDLRILAVNSAFLDLAQLPTPMVARGRPLSEFLGRPGVDLNVLVGNLRQFGSVRSFSTVLRNQFDGLEDVDVSAVWAADSDPPCLGFSIRVDRRRPAAVASRSRELPRSVEQLTDLVGRVSLKEIVRETADIIERLCIEAALELSRNNRASAAEILGLSRQSLYSKLHRYGLVDLDIDSANSE